MIPQKRRGEVRDIVQLVVTSWIKGWLVTSSEPLRDSELNRTNDRPAMDVSIESIVILASKVAPSQQPVSAHRLRT